MTASGGESHMAPLSAAVSGADRSAV